MKKINKKAFTLIEVIVVVAIIGILVLLGVPRFIGHTQRAELARIQHDVKVMEQEIGVMLINKDDDPNNWESNSNDFNQLIQENKLFDKEGLVEEVKYADETYKIIPEKYKDKINTKLKGTFYANSDEKVYYEHGKPLFKNPTGPGNPDPEEPVNPGNPDPEEPVNPGNPDPEEPENPGPEEPGGNDGDIGNNGGLMNPIESREPITGEIPIATAEELNSIRSNTPRIYGEGTEWKGEYTGGLDKKYVQVANIDLSGYSKGEGWAPIGAEGEEFKGSFDGNGHKITGLTINRPETDNVGLFGFTEQSTISNVSLENVNVTGKSNVGGLVGNATNDWGYQLTPLGTNITNSYVTGSVKASDGVAGGLMGRTKYSDISNSYATASVGGVNSAGGLVGWALNSTISNTYATGSAKGGNYAGGLSGYINHTTKINRSYSTGPVTVSSLSGTAGGLVGYGNNTSSISNSYATGSVTSPIEGTNTYVGGLVGSSAGITIRTSYATGLVTGRKSFSGGLVGSITTTSSVTGSFWDKNTTGQHWSAGATDNGTRGGKTTAEMMTKSTFSGPYSYNFDFVNVWEIDEGKGYPTLR